MRLRTTALFAAAVLATGALVTAAPSQAAKPAGTATCKTVSGNADVDATARRLAIKFFTLLQAEDRTGLKAFLDPAFISVDGRGVAKTRDELVNGLLPNIQKFKVSRMHAEVSGSLLTAHYLVAAAGDINGQPYSISAAPRLSTFTFCTGTWRLVSHANFDPLRS